MPTAIDVANAFVELGASTNTEMTNMKIIKLVFLAQAWSLARYGQPIFEEDFQAWEHGPVVPTVYNAFKQYGKERITKTTEGYDETVFSPQEEEIILDVFREYGSSTAFALRNMTHRVGTPWEEVYSLGENATISKRSIMKYYDSLDPLPEFHIPKDIPTIGYRDEDGLIVLPKEYLDERVS